MTTMVRRATTPLSRSFTLEGYPAGGTTNGGRRGMPGAVMSSDLQTPSGISVTCDTGPRFGSARNPSIDG
jgi:hypothetical protein